MNSKTKVILALAFVIALAGLAAGGALVTNRVALAAVPVTAPDDNSASGCGGMMGGSGGMMGGYGMFLDQVTLDKIAQLIKTPTQDIQTQLQNGKSLVEIANGKATEQQLVNLIIALPKEVLDLRVKHGYLTQDEASQALQEMEQAAKNFVNSKGQGTGPNSGPRNAPGGPSMDPGSRGGTGMMGGYQGNGGMMGGNRSSGPSSGRMMSGYGL